MAQKEYKENLYNALKKFHGSMAKVADLSGFHRTYVRLVLTQADHHDNDDIWIAAAQVLLDLKEGKAKKQEKAAKIMKGAQAITLF